MIRRLSKAQLLRRSALSFTIFISVAVAGAAAFRFLLQQESLEGQPKLLRKGLEFNDAVWMRLAKSDRNDPVRKGPPKGTPARVNGDIGLESPIDLERWKMSVEAPIEGRDTEILNLGLNQIKSLPRTEIVNQFKCIEGWSEIMSFAGVRFSDFMKAYRLDPSFKYVGLETPDGEYYVSVDMRSMMNPQTLLAFEQNGEPLTLEHGAPLRLVIPTKYGVKNLKRIGKIRFSNERLPDYWGESGYDWGLSL